MSNRLNRAVTADAVASDDDYNMTKMLIVSRYNRQNGHTLEDDHQQKKNTMFHLPTAISKQNPKVSYAVK
jgi:hypothetical protein